MNLIVKSEVDYSAWPGLFDEQVSQLLQTEGYNELVSSKPRQVWLIAWDVVKEPMFMLLIICGGIYLLLGDIGEALLLLFSIGVIISIAFYQERKTERALEALKDLSSPRALVIRGGASKRIPGREVVRGDIIILSEGDRVPADAVVLSTDNLSVDESLLTGESISVQKTEWDKKQIFARPGGDNQPFVYSSTLIIQGRGVAQVRAVGANTEVGKIGKSLQILEREQTLLQKEIKVIVKRFAIWGVLLCLVLILSYGLTTAHWLEGFLAGLALAMSLLPEEFPVILTIFLALGAWRLSRKSVLTRRVPVIETLGATTVLCVDKTGTLTMNHMAVVQLFIHNSYYQAGDNKADFLPEEFHTLVEFSVLASHKDPFDPMEKAIIKFGSDNLNEAEHWHNNWELVRQYPLSKNLLAMSQVWKSVAGEEYTIAAKGAPEDIMDLCHLSKEATSLNLKQVENMANAGLRVLGVAKAVFKKHILPADQHDLPFEFLGFVGFHDPIRTQVPQALQECYNAGIRTLMITGDYPGTALKIAHQIGLRNTQNILTGTELDTMSDKELQEKIKSTDIFARVVPEQKLRLVQALKNNKEVVAMTGDGVNDAPALKAAHVGLAMGQRGTDVAREAADMVLLDDDFSSIVEAVKQGRVIFTNISKAMSYVIAIHLPIAALAIIPVLLGWPLALLPVHIVFLEFIIDPACSMVFEAEPAEVDVMKHQPRKLDQPLFNKHTLLISILQGLVMILVVLLVYGFFLRTVSADEARTISFITLVAANIGLILSNRSWSQNILYSFRTYNRFVFPMIILVVVGLGLVIKIPFLSHIFQFGQVSYGNFVYLLLATLISIICFEFIKFLRPRY